MKLAYTHSVGPRALPTSRLAIVACAGLVAFLALMEAGLAAVGYASCGRTGSQNMPLALVDLGIAAVSYFVFLLGAIKLRHHWEIGRLGYICTIVALLLTGGILSVFFVVSSTCAG